MKYYAVIDTNVLVSSMLTSNPGSTIAKIINYVRHYLPISLEEINSIVREVRIMLSH